MCTVGQVVCVGAGKSVDLGGTVTAPVDPALKILFIPSMVIVIVVHAFRGNGFWKKMPAHPAQFVPEATYATCIPMAGQYGPIAG